MQFKKVNYEKLKLNPNDALPSHIRMVEKGSSLANLAQQDSKETHSQTTPDKTK